MSRNLEAIPDVGPLISTALVASIPDPKVFRFGRDLGAWMVPRQNSTGRQGEAVHTWPKCMDRLLIASELVRGYGSR